MYLPGSHRQHMPNHMYDASGTITTGGTPQLVLPVVNSRASLIFVNNSTANMLLEFGGARASCTISGGAVNSITVTNAGFNYSIDPSVTFYGGGFNSNDIVNPSFLGAIPPTPDWYAAANPAKAHCVMTGNAPNMSISSIVIDSGGSGYNAPPYVFINNSMNDPNGAALPSATVGILLLPNGSYTPNGTTCTTDALSVFCATMSSAFTCKYML